VLLYLGETITQKALKAAIAKLGIRPCALLRRKEAAFKATGLTDASKDADAINVNAKLPTLSGRLDMSRAHCLGYSARFSGTGIDLFGRSREVICID